jgi:hypothetical protein
VIYVSSADLMERFFHVCYVLTLFGESVLLLLLLLDNEGFLDRDYFGRLDQTLVTLFQMSMYFHDTCVRVMLVSLPVLITCFCFDP